MCLGGKTDVCQLGGDVAYGSPLKVAVFRVMDGH